MSETATTNVCNYKPNQGLNKDKPCLLPFDHDGPHIFDKSKVPAEASGDSDHFSAEEIANAISEDEIRKRSEKLDEAQSIWESAHDRSTPKIPCPECNTRGAVVGGSLGDACPTCHGARVIADPAYEAGFEMPTLEIDGKQVPLFQAFRERLSAYGDALAHRKHGLPSGLLGDNLNKRQRQAREAMQARMALPPASTVPTMEQIDELLQKGREVHKQLASAEEQPGLLRRFSNKVRSMLPNASADPPPRSGFETEGGIEATATDAEIDQMEREKGIR